MHQVASLIALAALAREESRGGHYRIDFPSKSSAFEKHSLLTAAPNADAKITFA
jgi:L-aspartate oxidase